MIYALLGLCVAFLLVIAYLAYALVKSVKSERVSMASETIATKAQLTAERNQIEAERQRDEAAVKAATAQATADKALGQLATTQAALNAATTRLVEQVKRDVLGASPAQVTQIVADLLGAAILPGPGGK